MRCLTLHTFPVALTITLIVNLPFISEASAGEATLASSDLGRSSSVKPLTVAETVLHSFDGVSDGAWPYAPLIEASDGLLYGSTPGAPGCGSLFRFSRTNASVKVFHVFSGSDGCYPQGPLLEASDGALYGIASRSGDFVRGTLFRIGHGGEFRKLDDFGDKNGREPEFGVMQASDGRLYGTTKYGARYRVGGLYRVDDRGRAKSFHAFEPLTGGGAYPNGPLMQADDGNLYGVAGRGGPSDFGTVYRVDAGGNVTTLYALDNLAGDGEAPAGGLVQGADRALYGAAGFGGSGGMGVLFRLTLDGRYTILHAFAADGSEGAYPYYGVVSDGTGALYGVCYSGGAFNKGTVFRLNADRSFEVLHSFAGAPTDGDRPYGAPLVASDGQLYGTTQWGGANNYGIIYRLDIAAGSHR